MRNGESTIADWKLLTTLCLENRTAKQISNFKTRLACTNQAVSAYNYNMLRKNGTTTSSIKAIHNIKKASKMSPEGLGPVLCLILVPKLC